MSARPATASPPGPAWTPVPAPPDALCLDLANTRSWRGTPTPQESLHGPDDLIAWCRAHAGFPAAHLETLEGRWRGRPDEAAATFAEAIRLREAIYAAFHALASEAPPPASALAVLNRAFAAATPRTALAPLGGGFGWLVPPPAPDAVSLLAPVLWSAGDLLAGPRRARVRACANPQCRWLFLDDSKGGNRRWCSMSACGNRAKAHRHYRRRKGA